MPKLTPTQFSKIGESLYGPSWRAALADAIGVGERTVHRWQQRGAVIPDGIDKDLAALCRHQAVELTDLANRIDGKSLHPMQAIAKDNLGTIRFRRNQIIDYLYSKGLFDLNALAVMEFDKADRIQIAQLLGYSVSGFGDLPYADADVVALADKIAKKVR